VRSIGVLSDRGLAIEGDASGEARKRRILSSKNSVIEWNESGEASKLHTLSSAHSGGSEMGVLVLYIGVPASQWQEQEFLTQSSTRGRSGPAISCPLGRTVGHL